MKKYGIELGFGGVQLLLFYLLPLFAGPTDAMGMVFLLLLSALVLALLVGVFSKNVLKVLYPPAIGAAFLPTVFLYYNGSALVHTVWYFTLALVGLGLGSLLRLLIRPAAKQE